VLTSSAIYDWTHTYDDAARQAVLTVLDGLAEFERELILARTNDGRVRAKARGVKFDRPAKLAAR